MNRFLAALAACISLLIPAVALAQPAVVPHYWNGTRFVPGQISISGAEETTEMNPSELQNDVFPAADSVTIFAGVLRPLGLGWSVSPFGNRSVTITRTQKGTPNTTKFYLFGSDDNVNYSPIVQAAAWTNSSVADTARFDTLMVTIPTQWQGPNTVRQFKIPLPEIEYPGRYLQLWVARFDSVYASNAMNIGLLYEGRWK